MDIKDILARCDHTLLRTDCTAAEIRALCDDAIRFGCASVCIPPAHVAGAKRYVNGQMKICTVIGFPNGYNTTAAKVFETEDAVKNGAEYIKTSTGFSKGGATFDDVALMRAHCAPSVKVKAAGGISSVEDAEHFIELGAERLGTSRIVKIAKQLEAEKTE